MGWRKRERWKWERETNGIDERRRDRKRDNEREVFTSQST